MEIAGLIVNDKKEVQYFIVKYPYNTAVYTVEQMHWQLKHFKVNGVKMNDGKLRLTKDFPKYRVEGMDKVEAIIHILNKSPELSKQLAGIDEEKAEFCLSGNEIYISKSYRDDEFFTEYDYEENGYNDAQFIGWDTIPDLVIPYLKEIGISKKQISCSGGDKLWFSVQIDCSDFAKLTSIGE